MHDRTKLLSLAIAGLTLGLPANHFAIAQPSPSTRPAHAGMAKGVEKDDDEDGEKGEHHAKWEHGEKSEHEGHEDEEEHGKKQEKEIETDVPMNMVPSAVLEAVKKEVPNGKITEAELEVKKGKIVYGFDVTDGAIAYDINISVDGKFISKAVDDEADEKDEAGEKGEMHGHGDKGEKGEKD